MSEQDVPSRIQADTDKIERQREHFDSIALEYRAGRDESTHRMVKYLIWKCALRQLRPLEGKSVKVLEPMCGLAEGKSILETHLDLHMDYSGFDYSPEIIKLVKEKSLDIDVSLEDVTKYRPLSRSYDLIILIGGLHHVPDYASSVVANLSEGLNAGGMFISFEPTSGNPLSTYIRNKIYNTNKIFDQETERAFTVTELFAMFEQAGLQQSSALYPGLLAYILYYNTYAFPFLNKGGAMGVKAAWALDGLARTNLIGRFFSFATLSVWQRP